MTPAAFIGYDTLALVQNIDFIVVDEVAYKAALEGQSDTTKKEALEELRWAIKDKEEHPLVLKILQFFSEREQLILGWEGIRLRDYTRQVVVLKGWIINEPHISRDLDRLNQFLRRQSLVCYCTAKDASELRRSLKLPPHFPLYRVEQPESSTLWLLANPRCCWKLRCFAGVEKMKKMRLSFARRGSLMLIQELFRRAVIDRCQVMQDIAEMLVPAIMREFAAVPALGGSEKPLIVHEPELQELLEKIPAYTAEEQQRFSAKGFDQSLSTHLINGLFAGMHLAERLPEHKELDTAGQRIWALGFTVHDYTKAYGRNVKAGQLAIIRKLVSRLGEKLGFSHFMSDWLTYLDDIVFIAQNTQTVAGANLNLRDYQLRLDKHQRETIRMLSSVTDLLVHITSPSDVFFRDIRGRDIAYNLRQKLDALFGAELAPRLAYHKLLEVRGLLSNLINNALIDVLRRQEYEPFLFFPEGVIYLTPQNTQAQIDLASLTKAAWDRVAKLLAGGRQINDEDDEDERERRAEDEAYKGLYEGSVRCFMNYSAWKHWSRQAVKLQWLFATVKPLLVLVLNRQRSADWILRGLARKKKRSYYTAIGLEWAREQALPTDIRADQLAEYLAFLYRRIFAELIPKPLEVTQMLLDVLGLSGKISA